MVSTLVKDSETALGQLLPGISLLGMSLLPVAGIGVLFTSKP